MACGNRFVQLRWNGTSRFSTRTREPNAPAARENLKAVLEAGGSSLAKVVKVTIYMTDLGELLAMNEVFSGYFPADPPAQTTFQAAGLVPGARVEIEAIATA